MQRLPLCCPEGDHACLELMHPRSAEEFCREDASLLGCDLLIDEVVGQPRRDRVLVLTRMCLLLQQQRPQPQHD